MHKVKFMVQVTVICPDDPAPMEDQIVDIAFRSLTIDHTLFHEQINDDPLQGDLWECDFDFHGLVEED